MNNSNLPSPLITSLLIIARSEIGIKEIPPGSNRGPRVEEYLKSVHLGPGYAWCAAFVYWCYKKACMGLNLANPLLATGSCLNHWNKTTGKRITSGEVALNPALIGPGDIFIIRRNEWQGHTGIVTAIDGAYIKTIEGNANSFHSAEGDGVVELKRKIDSINVGFIKYS
jgi:hypothetical protein